MRRAPCVLSARARHQPVFRCTYPIRPRSGMILALRQRCTDLVTGPGPAARSPRSFRDLRVKRAAHEIRQRRQSRRRMVTEEGTGSPDRNLDVVAELRPGIVHALVPDERAQKTLAAPPPALRRRSRRWRSDAPIHKARPDDWNLAEANLSRRPLDTGKKYNDSKPGRLLRVPWPESRLPGYFSLHLSDRTGASL